MLKIKNLHASIAGKSILNGVDLSLETGKVHVLMGPNGSGKSTLAKTIAGHPDISITDGKMLLGNKNLIVLSPEERAREGIFIAFQYPVEIPGVGFRGFLRMAYNNLHPAKPPIPTFRFRRMLQKEADFLDFPPDLIERNLNEGLSGGEKKKSEILQLSILKPKLAILDETDSGLDIDATRDVFRALDLIHKMRKSTTFLIITHSMRIFDYIKPDFVHVLKHGKITDEGSSALLKTLAKSGFKG